MIPKLTITGYSATLFSYWLFNEELETLLDRRRRRIGRRAGINIPKGEACIHISHVDRDHLTRLPL